MKERRLIVLFVVISLSLLLALAGLLIARGTSKTLPSGSAVAGIDVSSLTIAQARAKIAKKTKRDQLTLLSKGVSIKDSISRKAILAPAIRELEKINNSQSFFNRILKNSQGRKITLRYRYNKKALRSLFLRFQKTSEKRPQNATVSFNGDLEIKRGRIGKKLEARSWKKTKAAASRGQSALLLQKKAWRPPFLSKRDIFRDSPAILVVDKSTFSLHLYKGGRLLKTYPVATGKSGFETPSGSFRISNKAIDPAWSVPEWGGELAGQVIPGGSSENPLINRWLGIIDGVGIHGTRDTYSLGSQASHGCIRMDPEQVIELYDQVPVNSRIIIT